MGYGGDGFVLRAIGAVLGDLADIGGYEARWVTVAAADVGAPHRRERVFILASAADAEHAGSRREADDARGREPNSSGRSWRGQSEGLGATSSGRSHPLVDAPNSARIGSDGGLPESAGIVGRPDAAVSGDEPGRVELLPTPCVVDRLASGEMTLDEWDESRKSQKERGVGSFGPRGDSLGAAVLRVEEGSERPDYSTTKARRGDEPGVALLPTPVSAVRDRTLTEVTGRMATRSIGSANLDEVVIRDFHSSLLPTPRTSDTNGAGHHGDGGMDLDGLANAATEAVTDLPSPLRAQGKADSTGKPPESGLGSPPLLPTPRNTDGERGPSAESGGTRPSGQPRQKDLNTVTVRELGAGYGSKSVEIAVGEDGGAVPVLTGDGGGDNAVIALNSDGVAVGVRSGEKVHTACVAGELAGTKHESALLPTPAAADGQRGQDFARANRDGSGGDDLVTLAVKADRDSAWGKYAPAIARWESLTRPAPAPTEPNKNGNPRLSAEFSQWLMGWPDGWVTDPAIGISRNDQLRILGNGVVSIQAEAALRYLLAVTA